MFLLWLTLLSLRVLRTQKDGKQTQHFPLPFSHILECCMKLSRYDRWSETNLHFPQPPRSKNRSSRKSCRTNVQEKRRTLFDKNPENPLNRTQEEKFNKQESGRECSVKSRRETKHSKQGKNNGMDQGYLLCLAPFYSEQTLCKSLVLCFELEIETKSSLFYWVG